MREPPDPRPRPRACLCLQTVCCRWVKFVVDELIVRQWIGAAVAQPTTNGGGVWSQQQVHIMSRSLQSASQDQTLMVKKVKKKKIRKV